MTRIQLPAALLLLVACGKSSEQRHRELVACIAVGTDESRAVTDPYKVGFCLENRFAWDGQEVQDAQVQISVIQRQIRAQRDSLARGRRRGRR